MDDAGDPSGLCHRKNAMAQATTGNDARHYRHVARMPDIRLIDPSAYA
jgi:putative NADPH-quinone reductase